MLVCLSACLHVCLSPLVCLSACLLVCLFAGSLVCLSACLLVCWSACLLVCLLVRFFNCWFVWSSVCLAACLSVCFFARFLNESRDFARMRRSVAGISDNISHMLSIGDYFSQHFGCYVLAFLWHPSPPLQVHVETLCCLARRPPVQSYDTV